MLYVASLSNALSIPQRGREPGRCRCIAGAFVHPEPRRARTHATPFHSLAERGVARSARLVQRQLKCYTKAPPFHLRRIPRSWLLPDWPETISEGLKSKTPVARIVTDNPLLLEHAGPPLVTIVSSRPPTRHLVVLRLRGATYAYMEWNSNRGGYSRSNYD